MTPLSANLISYSKIWQDCVSITSFLAPEKKVKTSPPLDRVLARWLFFDKGNGALSQIKEMLEHHNIQSAYAFQETQTQQQL
jgi:hypothetical protein